MIKNLKMKETEIIQRFEFKDKTSKIKKINWPLFQTDLQKV